MQLRPKPLLFALGAGCAGFLLNHFELPLFGGTVFVFGGAFSLLTAYTFGPVMGGLAAVIAFSKIWLQWQSPAGFACYTLEAIVVGWLIRRRRVSTLYATALYWALVGCPLLLILLNWLRDLPFPLNWAVMIKFPLNGILMAAIAVPITNAPLFRRWLKLPALDHSDTPLRLVLFRRFGIMATLPLMLLMLLMGQTFDRTLRRSAETNLWEGTQEITHQLDRTFTVQQESLHSLAQQIQSDETGTKDLPSRLAKFRREHPEFHFVKAFDRHGTLLAKAEFAHQGNNSSTANPEPVETALNAPPFPATKITPQVSDVFRGPDSNQDYFVTISTPILQSDHTVQFVIEGALPLSGILTGLTTDNRLHNRSLLLVDRAQNVVLSLGEAHLPRLSALANHPLHYARPGDGVIFPFDWQALGDTRAERYFALSAQIASCGWRVTLMEPAWNTQSAIANFYAVAASWSLLAIGLALWLARDMASDITQSLTQITSTMQSLVDAEAKQTVRPNHFPSWEFSIISTDLHHAAHTLSMANRKLAGAITARDQSHRELSQVLLHLDEEVRDRTAQLEEAREIAESSNNAKSGFLASMSHELRTPLNVILGMSEILHEKFQGPLTDRQLECVVAIEESGRHLLNLINDILDLSKIEAGMLQLDCQETIVREVGDASLRLVRESATKKSIRLSATYDEAAVRLIADSRRLKQILFNLLSNAVKFTPEGGTVSLQVTQSHKGDSISFAVQDSGIGIDPKNQEKLFQNFQQIDNDLNRKYAGTGLGLVLVKRMTQMHGGIVQVASEPGKGARFTIILPLHPEGSTPPFVPPVPVLSNTGIRGATIVGEPLILIAEDNALNVQVYTEHLRQMNCRFSFATTGREAITRALADHPDLVLMDMHMPEMGGLEAIKQMRSDTRTAQLPIIAVTGLANPEDRIQCLTAGASSYLSKPVRLKELTAQIATLLNRKPATKPPTASTQPS